MNLHPRAPIGEAAWCPPFKPMADRITPGEQAGATIDTFEIDDEAARLEALRAHINGRPHMTISPGRYARLRIDGTLAMSDTDHERRTTYRAYRDARGHVLIHGLGVAMLPTALQDKPKVESVTIVEIDQRVIDLLQPTLDRYAPKARVIHADAFLPETTGLPRTRDGGGFDYVFSDIWPTISGDDYPEHIAIRRAWQAWRRKGSRHDVWVEGEVKAAWRESRAGIDAIHRRDPYLGMAHPKRAWPTRPARQVATDLLASKRAAVKEA